MAVTVESERLLFRMQHLIPQGLRTFSATRTNHSVTLLPEPTVKHSKDGPEEWTFQMTWGKIAAKIWGPPDGRPVIAIHGWMDNASSFDTLIPLLPKDLRIVAIDVPGHGLSDHYPPDINYNFYDCLPAIQRLANHFKWDKFSFLAHCLGGCMAIIYAGIFPERVDKVVLLDVVRVQVTRPETMHIRLRKAVNTLLKLEDAVIAGPEKPFSYETALKRCINGTWGSLDVKACNLLFERGLKAVDGGYVYTRDRRLKAAPLAFAPKEDQLVMARQVTGEILIIKMTEGLLLESMENYEEHMEALRTKAKRVEYIEVEGKHHTHLTHPERVASLISNFFNS